MKPAPKLPGDVLQDDYLGPSKLTQGAAAQKMGMPLNRLNEILRGRRAITADTALRLAKLFKDSTAEFWMAIQAAHDLHQAVLHPILKHRLERTPTRPTTPRSVTRTRRTLPAESVSEGD